MIPLDQIRALLDWWRRSRLLRRTRSIRAEIRDLEQQIAEARRNHARRSDLERRRVRLVARQIAREIGR